MITTGLLGIGFFLFLVVAAINRPVFHDEFSFLSNSLNFIAFKTLAPYFTNYPSLYSYIISVPITFLFFAITAVQLPAHAPLDPYAVSLIFDLNLATWLITTRLLSVLSWAAIVLLTVRLANQRYGARAAMVAALLTILDPYKIFLTQAWLALPDVMIAAIILSGYSLCENYIRNGRPQALLGASVLAGIAAGLKLNGALLIIPVLVTPWIPRGRPLPGWLTIKMFAVFLAVFLAGSPFLLITPHSFLQGLQVEGQLLFNQHLTPGITGNIAWLISNLWRLDPLATILLFLTVIFSIYRGLAPNNFFLTLLVATLIIIGPLDKQSLYYYLFLFPLGAIQAAGLFRFCEHKLAGKLALKGMYAVTAILLITYFFKTTLFIQKHNQPDNRHLAEQWILSNIPAGSSIILDWAYIPQIEIKRVSKFIKNPALHTPNSGPGYAPLYRMIIQTFRGKMQYYQTSSLVNNFYQPSSVIQNRSRYLITSSSCYQRYRDTTSIPAWWGDPHMDRLELNRFVFYRMLLDGELPYRILKRFNNGTGPEVLIFERMQ